MGVLFVHTQVSGYVFFVLSVWLLRNCRKQKGVEVLNKFCFGRERTKCLSDQWG